MRLLPAEFLPRLWHAPALLLFLQAVPLHSEIDATGRVRLALGASTGGYEDRGFDCGGNVVRRAPVKYQTIGGQAELWATPRFRIAAAGGAMHATTDSTWTDARDGVYGSGLVAFEGSKLGIGGGVSFWPASSGTPSKVVPALYARFGRADKVHFRIDDNASSAPGSPLGFRIGLASGYSPANQLRWLVGAELQAFGPRSDVPKLGAELGIPLGDRLQPILQGGLGFADGKADWHAGFGLRASLGRARP